MNKAPLGLHGHGVTSAVLCTSEGSCQEGEKDLKEKAITGLRVGRSQGEEKRPNQLAALDPRFPVRKEIDPLLSKSC